MSDKTVKPIKPEDVGTEKLNAIPPEVFEVFNEIIVKNFYNGESTVTQHIAVQKIVELYNERNPYNTIDSVHIHENGWLNIEEAYIAQGWKVHYDKPGYNENYPAYFEFRK